MINPCYNLVVQPINIVWRLVFIVLRLICSLEEVWRSFNARFGPLQRSKIESLCLGVDTYFSGVNT